MSEDSFTEVTHTSWGGRIKSSLKGIVFGLILFVGAFPLLFWNEGRAVKRYQTLKEGEGAVVSVSPDRIDPANQGRLVHLSGRADTHETLTDATFTVTQAALRLRRTVEMYQWEEARETRTEKKVGGGEKQVTTYSYTRVWSTSPIDSSRFKRRSGHENPTTMPYRSETRNASEVTVGAFVLSTAQVQKIDNWQPVGIDPNAPVPEALGSIGSVYGDSYYRGQDPNHPAIGDIRITFKAVYPGPVSLVAAQQGRSFGAYATRAGGTISLLQTGQRSAVEMFKTAHFHNRLLTWAIRAGGLLLMFIGLGMVLKPLSVFADVIPFVGNLIEAGTGLLAFVLAVFFGLMVMGVAWLFYRPLLGVSLMGAGAALAAWMIMRRKGKAPARLTPAPPPAPPSTGGPGPPPTDTNAVPPTVPPSMPPPTPPAADGSITGGLSADGWVKAGAKAYADGNLDDATAAFEKATALDVEHGTAWYNLGVVRNNAGDKNGAVDAFRQAARLGHPRAVKLLSAQRIDR